ncbi:hypothetical protein PHYSODRAFT_256379 [Phytophthora sojae]|uniref:Uncharacterized protein n=1 Tax=Phytophthora sojae (strain P6497) TaxID=1094619 RepID=G5A3A6_PHYSP|nr:hypothetical protein PHYSODRAFT_256379 [Phytophthora sojae]EGZ10146.1 hypothetical protein PHYSODRAFT_256379 [Phytophthora sojae]|eukprot:XP_009535007.1 hypothetical protein PHYSODRAFT_256379 [Phytophthora sojae]
MDVTAVGVGLTPAQRDETMTDLSFFLDEFGSTRAARIKLQEQQREIGILETQVRYLLMDRNRGLPSPQEEGKTTDSENQSPGNYEFSEESVDDTMADLDFFLRIFGSTRAVREKLENQERKVVGLRRTVQWFQDRRGEDDDSDSAGSSDVERW